MQLFLTIAIPPPVTLQVEAQVLAGQQLMRGGGADAQDVGGSPGARAGRGGIGIDAPACAGQAYFVTDGRPVNPQGFLDGVLDGLGRQCVGPSSTYSRTMVDTQFVRLDCYFFSPSH